MKKWISLCSLRLWHIVLGLRHRNTFKYIQIHSNKKKPYIRADMNHKHICSFFACENKISEIELNDT